MSSMDITNLDVSYDELKFLFNIYDRQTDDDYFSVGHSNLTVDDNGNIKIKLEEIYNADHFSLTTFHIHDAHACLA